MHRIDESLSELIQTGKKQGFITYSQVNAYLPDEAPDPEKLDYLLMSIDEMGMDIVPDKDPPYRRPEKKGRKGKTNGAIGDDTMHLPQVAVHPAAQGRGLGRALLARAATVAAGAGRVRLTLSVSCGNLRAAGWYGRLGFEELARFSAYYRDP